MTCSNNQKEKILIILTGGTICSVEDIHGERSSDTASAKYKIISSFRSSSSPFRDTEFDFLAPLNILSENMTTKTWTKLLDGIRSIENPDSYKGIIILHGTDTLAFTSSMLSLMLTHLNCPVFLVSSQLPLDSEGTNGNVNFRAAAELIMNGIKPNVYAVYKNSDGNIYLHYGSQLQQCKNYSNDFFSKDAIKIQDESNACAEGIAFETKNDFINTLGELSNEVLYIAPYVGINYDCYNLDSIRAVVHGTYHSDTVCVERSRRKGVTTNFSIIEFARKCALHGTSLFLAHCNPETYAYESTGDALENGALAISGMTVEMAYVKTLIGVSLGYEGNSLSQFVNTGINNEIIYY